MTLTQRGPLGSGPGEGGGCRKEGNRVKSLSPLPRAAQSQARGELSWITRVGPLLGDMNGQVVTSFWFLLPHPSSYVHLAHHSHKEEICPGDLRMRENMRWPGYRLSSSKLTPESSALTRCLSHSRASGQCWGCLGPGVLPMAKPMSMQLEGAFSLSRAGFLLKTAQSSHPQSLIFFLKALVPAVP